MCNTFLESLGIAHWVQPVYVILIRVGPFSNFFRPRILIAFLDDLLNNEVC